MLHKVWYHLMSSEIEIKINLSELNRSSFFHLVIYTQKQCVVDYIPGKLVGRSRFASKWIIQEKRPSVSEQSRIRQKQKFNCNAIATKSSKPVRRPEARLTFLRYLRWKEESQVFTFPCWPIIECGLFSGGRIILGVLALFSGAHWLGGGLSSERSADDTLNSKENERFVPAGALGDISQYPLQGKMSKW